MEKELMDFEEFKERMMSVLRERTGAEVSEEEVRKNNGVTISGMMLKEKGVNAAPVFYFRDFYENYRKGRDIGKTADMLERLYLENRQFKDLDVSFVTDWEKAREKIEIRLVNYEMNKEMLGNVPHIQFLDLAVIFYIGMGDSAMLIGSAILEKYGKTPTDLYEEGLKNMNTPYSFMLSEVVNKMYKKELQKKAEDTEKMYVVTNSALRYGAAGMLDKEFMRDVVNFGERVKCCIIPSSVHEVILIPVEKDTDIEWLRGIVREVNDIRLSKEEVLSYNIYVYDNEKDEITIA